MDDNGWFALLHGLGYLILIAGWVAAYSLYWTSKSHAKTASYNGENWDKCLEKLRAVEEGLRVERGLREEIQKEACERGYEFSDLEKRIGELESQNNRLRDLLRQINHVTREQSIETDLNKRENNGTVTKTVFGSITT